MGTAPTSLIAAETPPHDARTQKLLAVGRLTAGVSHDFNNLLQALRHTLELAHLQADDPQAVRRWVESGLRQVDRGSRLTGQLLAFAAARVQRPRAVAVTRLLQDMQEMLQRTLGPAVRVWVPGADWPEPGYVLADPVQLEASLVNLALNARDAMPEGGQLSLSAELRTLTAAAGLADGGYVAISVADTGHGMTAPTRDRAFEPFFTTKAVGEGSGLGLSQVYGFARQSGGLLVIESSTARGTTLVLWLPACDAPDGPPAAGDAPDAHTGVDGGLAAAGSLAPAARARALASAAPNAARADRGVIVADADTHVRRGICDGLRSLGWRAVPALDGLAALAALDRHAPASIVIDLAMPGIGGAELARLAQRARPDLVVIYTDTPGTAAPSPPLPPGARVLHKPFEINQLGEALNAELAARDEGMPAR